MNANVLTRLVVTTAIIVAAIIPARADVILWNDNNFPDPVLKKWLETWITTNHPTAWGITANKEPTLDTQGIDFITALIKDPIAAQVTDLRCLKFFPDFTGSNNTGTLDLQAAFPALDAIDVSGWPNLQYFFVRTPTRATSNIKYARFKDCKSLLELMFDFVGPLDIFDLNGCQGLRYLGLHDDAVSAAHTAGTLPNYVDAPRLRYLDIESSTDVKNNKMSSAARGLALDNLSQLAILKMPDYLIDKSTGQKTTFDQFRLSGTMVSDLKCTAMNGADVLDLSNNHLETIKVEVPQMLTSWSLYPNNLSHLELTAPPGGTAATIPAATQAEYFNIGYVDKFDLNPFTPYGTAKLISGATDNNGVLENFTNSSVIYSWDSNVSGTSFTANMGYLTEPMEVTLTSYYELNKGVVELRKTPQVYTLAIDTKKDNEYECYIPELVGPYTISATRRTKGSNISQTYFLKGSPVDATYNDEPETDAVRFDRTMTRNLTPSWWPSVITTKLFHECGYIYTLQAATYFNNPNSSSTPATYRYINQATTGQTPNGSLGDLELTTVNSWTGKGSVLRKVKVQVGYINDQPLGYLYFREGSTTGLDDIVADGFKGDGNEVDNSDAPVEWYTLQGQRTSSQPTAPGIYIRRQGTKATKVRL